MEHELWVRWDPVWVRASERERQPHIRNAWRQGGEYSYFVDCGTSFGLACATDRGPHERQNLERAGQAEAILSCRSDPVVPGTVGDAEFTDVVGGGRFVVY